MVFNQLGTILQPLGYLLLYLLPTPTLPTWLLALPSIPIAIVGMDAVISNLFFSYAGDVSHGKSARSTSIRFIIIDALSALSTPIGLYGGNFILQRGGFVWLFGVITGISVVCVLYVVFAVTNIIPHRNVVEGEDDKSPGEDSSCCSGLSRLLQTLLSSVTRERRGNGRSVNVLLLVILGTHAISYTCDTNISYIFLQTKFGFDQTDFSDLQSVHFALTGAGALLTIALIQLTDVNIIVIGLISSLSKLGYYLE